MELNFQIFPDQAEIDNQIPLIILPGLFGSISNWRSVAKQLSAQRIVIVLDQRNHGRSPHADSHSYADMVEDLREFCAQHGLNSIDLAGHSMGGKVAMLFALKHVRLVRKLVVLDIAPVTYTHSHAPFLSALLDIDLTALKSRKAADVALQSAISDTPTRLFLLQSLAGKPGGYYWRLNLATLHREMGEIVGFPNTDVQSLVSTLAVNGEMSTYLQLEHHAKLQQLFPKIQFATVAGAGHWLHAERPIKVIEIIDEFLK